MNFLFLTNNFLKMVVLNLGIYAVIQNLSFRKNPVTGQCRDYVEMHYYERTTLVFFKANKIKQQFCGKITPKESFSETSNPLEFDNIFKNSSVSENAFVANDELTVKIYIAKEKLKPDEKLDIHIVFTAFKFG